MRELKTKYASLLLKCVRLEDKDYLYVELPSFLEEFKSILEDEIKKYNLKEYHFEVKDVFKKHDLMRNLSQYEIYNNSLFDNSIKNKYSALDAAFLFIDSNVPDLMADIDAEKIKNTNIHLRKTEKEFRDKYENNKLNWCIAGAANSYWAKSLDMSEDELWNLLFKVCLVDKETDPYTNWMNKVKILNNTSNKLNELDLEYLEYKNNIGTNLKVYLPEGHIWCSGDESGVLVNLPTEEVFTSPRYDKTDGIVYSTKPLIYNNVVIDEFYIEFKDGKVINYDAKVGKDILKGIIETDDHSCYLGECALVSYDSPISNTGVVFKDTLYDENASCHLALGTGFSECVKGGLDKINEEILELGVNFSKTHVDFMIGSSDLNIVGVKKDGTRVTIMENGNIII